LFAVASESEPRFLLYSHDAVGLGHVQRNLTIARALVGATPGCCVLVVTGAEGLGALTIPESVDVLRLPGVRKVDNRHYAPRRLAVEAGELSDLRAGLLDAAVERFRPDVLLADKHPFGVRGELLPALHRLRAQGGRAALGLRDVLDAPAHTRAEWSDETLRDVLAHHDRVLVYGQQGLLEPLDAALLQQPALAKRLRYCGYVVAPPVCAQVPPRRRGLPLVVAAVGGGEDGALVLKTFVTASIGAPWRSVAVAGPNAADGTVRALQHPRAGADVRIVRSIPALGTMIGKADAVVCMGGYNTLVEVLAGGVPAVCVPRVVPRTEQLVRATAFARAGLLRVVEPDDLNPAALRAAIEAALWADRDALSSAIATLVRLDGAPRAAAALLELAVEARELAAVARPPRWRRALRHAAAVSP
jgi:predicted glycosyltransferase